MEYYGAIRCPLCHRGSAERAWAGKKGKKVVFTVMPSFVFFFKYSYVVYALGTYTTMGM